MIKVVLLGTVSPSGRVRPISCEVLRRAAGASVVSVTVD